MSIAWILSSSTCPAQVSEIEVEFDGGKMAFHAALTALTELPQAKREEGAVPLFDQVFAAAVGVWDLGFRHRKQGGGGCTSL